MTRRPGFLLLLAAIPVWGEEARPLPVRLEVTVLRQDSSTKALVPVPADSSFKTGDAVAFEVKASRGGYLALLSPGSAGQLWPPQTGGHPVPAQAAVRIPAAGLIRLAAPGPTKLSLVFSPRPLDGSSPRWLKQILLREAKLEAPAGPVVIFEGPLGDSEKAVVELELRHP